MTLTSYADPIKLPKTDTNFSQAGNSSQYSHPQITAECTTITAQY